MRAAARPLITLAVGLLVLGLIYWNIDLRRLLNLLVKSEPTLLYLALFLFIPTTLGTAWRLKILVPPPAHFGLAEASRLTLVAASLNVALPSKAGDIAKGVFIARRGHMRTAAALSLTMYEKACDLLALLAWCGLGLVWIPKREPLILALTAVILAGLLFGMLALTTPLAESLIRRLVPLLPDRKLAGGLERLDVAWSEVRAANSGRPSRAVAVGLISVAIWFLHLLQIWLFIRALGGGVPLLHSLGLTPLAILVGLLPLTMAGIGTRDAALIYFYSDYFGPATGAALGLLCTLRYVVPGIAGLPWLRTGWALEARSEVVSRHG